MICEIVTIDEEPRVGLVRALLEAQRRTGIDARITEAVISPRGDLVTERKRPFDGIASHRITSGESGTQ